MCPPTPTSPRSSIESAGVIDLKPDRSRLLAAWWAALHLLLLATVPWIGAAAIVKICAALCVSIHAVARYPQTPPRIVRSRGGEWAVPERGLTGLRLGPRTRYTTLWMRLSLGGALETVDVVLLVDQVGREDWRALQALLRRGEGAGAAAGPGRSARRPSDLR